MFFELSRLAIFSLFVFVFSIFPAHAQNDEMDIVRLANSMNEAISLHSPNFKPRDDAEAITHLIYIHDIEGAAELIKSSSSLSDIKRQIFENYLSLSSTENASGKESEAFLKQCADGHLITNTVDRYHCSNLLNNHYFRIGYLDDARIYSQKSASIISEADEQINPYIRLQIQESIFNTFALDFNLPKAIESASKMIDLVEDQALEIDYIGFVSNLITLAEKNGDAKTSTALAEILLNYSKGFSDDDVAYASYVAGVTYVFAEEYETAAKLFETSSRLSTDSLLVVGSDYQRALSLSKLGLHSESNRIVGELENGKFSEDLLSYFYDVKLQTQALNLAADGKTSEAYKLLEEWSDITVTSLKSQLVSDRRTASEALILSETVLADRLKNAELEADLAQSKVRSQRNILFFLGLLIATVGVFTLFLMDRSRKLAKSNRRLEIKSKEALAASDAKQRFLGMIGHEFRTPLNPIIALSEQISENPNAGSTSSFSKIIHSSGNRLHHLVENVLFLTNDEKPEIFISRDSVDDILTSVLEDLAPQIETSQVDIQVRRSADWTTYYQTSRTVVEVILRNLIDNAVKFSDAGSGTVEIILHNASMFYGWAVTIKDHGVGFDTELLPNLMKPFEQTDNSLSRPHEGAGIGLYVVDQHLQYLHAEMQIESEIGVGTSVTVNFPDLWENGQPIPQAALPGVTG